MTTVRWVGPMRPAVRTFTALACASLVLAGCRRPSAYGGDAGAAAAIDVVPCQSPAGTARSAGASAEILVTTTPAPADSALQAVLRFEGPIGEPLMVQVTPGISSRHEPLTAGTWYLIAQLDGYQRLSTRVVLPPGCTTRITFGLRRRP